MTENHSVPQRRRQLRDNVIWICLITFLIHLGGDILVSAFSKTVHPSTPFGKTLFDYLLFLGTWAAVLFALLIFPQNRPLMHQLTTKSKGNRLSLLIIGLFAGGLLNGLCALTAAIHGDFRLHFVRFEPLPILLLLLAVFVQSSAEEVLCRGFLYRRLAKGYGACLAIVLNSAFFALLHMGNDGINALALYDLFITGVFFSLIVYYFDSLWMAMTLHTSWNFTQNILLGLPNSGYPSPYSIFRIGEHTQHSFAYDPVFGLEGTVLSSLLMTACCAALYLWKGRPRNGTAAA